ncbi:MAG TPA: DUF695 domain-containing protein [Kofleriaceae bacterium]
MTSDGELWHIVEAKRDDGTPTMFRIREIDRQPQLTKIFVVELPYPKTELSRLPNAADYRRLAEFDEQWLRPACATLGWELVGSKTEDGSFFLYMYGSSDPSSMIARLSPFDAALGFYDDDDPDWQEYGTLKDLLDQAKAIPPADAAAPPPAAQTTPRTNQRAHSQRTTTLQKPQPRAAGKQAKATAKATPKASPKAAAKRAAKAPVKARAKPTSKPTSKAAPKAKGKPAARKRR